MGRMVSLWRDAGVSRVCGGHGEVELNAPTKEGGG